ncbi:hypothetical protein [Chitinimonas lacunae]|uniref:Uncharacterized protein n=1 Tax=Chitinimonas lacunae TaxID=1963018 RepID=A0ABV8MX47_9NEIS
MSTWNVWIQFKEMLASPVRQHARVATVHGDGTVTVQLLGGGLLRVSGEAEEGATVFVLGGRIDGPAPDLPAHQIEG